MTSEQRIAESLEEQDFYEICQTYRHAQEWRRVEGDQTVTEAFESLKAHIRSLIASVRAEAIEECAKVCEGNKLVSGSPGPLFNAGWHAANSADANAICALVKERKG